MIVSRLPISKLLKQPKIWLLGIACTLLGIYFNFCWLTRAIHPLAISLIFFSATVILLWRKRHTLTLKSDPFSSLLGTLLIAFSLFKICSLTGVGPILTILPLIAALGLALLASGIKGLKQYWQELTLLFALAIPGANFFLWWLKLGWLNYLIILPDSPIFKKAKHLLSLNRLTRGRAKKAKDKSYPVSEDKDEKYRKTFSFSANECESVSSANFPVKSTQIWLLCLTISLTTIYLYSLSVIKGISVLDHNILALLAVFWLLWQKRHQLHLNCQFYPSLLGTACLALVVVKTSGHHGIWLQTLPFFATVGMGLIASGFPAPKQYWRELVIFCVIAIFGIFKQPIEEHFALTTVTAQFSHFLLQMRGIDSIRQGTLIAFSPETAMDVVESCAGYSKIFWLVEIAIIYLLLFPSNRINILLVPTVAASIAFIANAIRIAILGVFLASGDETGFEYWHEGEGSQIFTIVPLVIFGSFCLYLVKRMEPEDIDTEEEGRLT